MSAWVITSLAALLLLGQAGPAAPTGESGPARVVLRWKPVATAAEYELEVARDPAFKDVVVRERVRVSGYRWNELPATTYYWRVRSVDAAGRTGDWSEVKQIAPAVSAPSPLRPAPGAVLPFTPGATVELSAAPSRLLRTWIFELSPDPRFERDVVQQRATQPRARVPLAAPGTFHWRVRGVDLEGRETPPGEARTLRVELGAPTPLPVAAPGVWTEPPPEVELSWQAPAGVTNFEVELAGPSGGPRVFRATGTSVRVPVAGPGGHSFRIRGEAGGGAGPWSAPQPFTVGLAPPAPVRPAPGAAVGAGEGEAAVSLEWTATPGAARYSVEVARDAEFTSVASGKRLAETRWRTDPLAPGSYHWRVTAEDEAGALRATSDPASFQVASVPALAAPSPRSPEPGGVLPRGEPPVMALSWSAVPRAESYELAVAPPGELDAITPTRTPEPRAELLGPAQGDYAWRVRAVDADGNAGPWSEPARFFFGLPATTRAEIQASASSLVADGDTTTEIRIRLFDGEGRPVRGAPVQVSTTAGRVEDVTAGADGYVARYRAPSGAPDSRAAWIIVRDRTFEATSKVVLTDAPDRLRLFAAAGWNATFGALSSPLLGAGVSYRLPGLLDRVSLGLRLGGYAGGARVPAVGGAPPLSAQVWVGRGSLVGLYEHPLRQSLSLHAGAGPSAQLVRLTLGDLKTTAAVPGAELLIGARYALGPGRVLSELSYSFGQLDDPDARLRTGGLSALLGYEVGFW